MAPSEPLTRQSPTIAIVAGPDAGHAFPAFALAERVQSAGYRVIVYTGIDHRERAARRSIRVVELPGLAIGVGDDDTDAGAKLSHRAARMAVLLRPRLIADEVDLVVTDVITVAGGWAAELCGLPWVELSPHPLYLPSRGRPPIGAGMEPGRGLRGRLRDSAMRAATGRSIRDGERQRRAARRTIGLPAAVEPAARLVATIPALEVWRPDWPSATHLIGPLLWEPTDDVFPRTPGAGPLIVVAPSTATTGAGGMVESVSAALTPARMQSPVRLVISMLADPQSGVCDDVPGRQVVIGLARQDEVLARADLVICGGGHGMLAKSLLAGVPVVTVPGGGDQWELASRVRRAGLGLVVNPIDVDDLAAAARHVLADPAYRTAAQAAAPAPGELADPVRVVERVLAGPSPTPVCGGH
ncbi:glycosyltransferase [Gordonia soli]|uniref:Putative glycosyltransferase n=1 Tax=Gordonia soli NBRC 108243 TaxID=1223545 RepID=M0QQ72_9ACTN|nr:nucleotide disphospho-sugar-binding domain-containing protein [Gordonia soli]GAC70835.1 putative glycosyltransferase [Gordonia soli NBRC 108243]